MKKIFKEAHKMTREMVKEYEVDYQAQFGLCLSYLLEIKKEEKEMETVEDIKNLVKKEMDAVEGERDFDIVKFEMNKWSKGGKNRIYFNISINTKGNSARRANGYIDIDKMRIYSTQADYKRYNEDTIEQIYQTLKANMKKVIEIVA